MRDKAAERWGFVDVNKNWVIAPQFKGASYFKDGLCAVNTVDGESVLVDRNGDVVFKRSSFLANVGSENFFLDKHGKYLILWEDMNKAYSTEYGVTLVNENYQSITADDVRLRTFSQTRQSPLVSKTLFWDENKMIFSRADISDEITVYYDKYFTVKKNNGTSALYADDGRILVDFGKWDNIYPSSISNRIIASNDGKCAVADYDGNLLSPLEYNNYNISNPFYYDGRYAYLDKDGKRVFVNMINLAVVDDGLDFGYKYHTLEYQIIDNEFNNVFVDKENIFIASHDDDYSDIMRYTSTRFNALIFNDSGVKVKIDDKRLDFDVLPVIQNGRTLVPMRAIFEALGASVEWNGEAQTITAKNKDVTLQMQIGNNTMTKNGQGLQTDVSPQLIDGRTMVPVRAISDCFNVQVDWNNYTRTISLFTN